MKIYINDFYNNKYFIKYKVDLVYIKNIINELYSKNNINYISIKLLYSILFLVKNNIQFKLINNIIYNKVLKVNYIKISKFMFNIIETKWYKLINIAIYNNVEETFIDYFLYLYKLYIEIEKCPNIFILQAKHIMNKKINYFRQLKRYFIEDIYYTLFYISIIFSRISINYININNIYDYN